MSYHEDRELIRLFNYYKDIDKAKAFSCLKGMYLKDPFNDDAMKDINYFEDYVVTNREFLEYALYKENSYGDIIEVIKEDVLIPLDKVYVLIKHGYKINKTSIFNYPKDKVKVSTMLMTGKQITTVIRHMASHDRFSKTFSARWEKEVRFLDSVDKENRKKIYNRNILYYLSVNLSDYYYKEFIYEAKRRVEYETMAWGVSHYSFEELPYESQYTGGHPHESIKKKAIKKELDNAKELIESDDDFNIDTVIASKDEEYGHVFNKERNGKKFFNLKDALKKANDRLEEQWEELQYS